MSLLMGCSDAVEFAWLNPNPCKRMGYLNNISSLLSEGLCEGSHGISCSWMCGFSDYVNDLKV